jgi:hypothetical protein
MQAMAGSSFWARDSSPSPSFLQQQQQQQQKPWSELNNMSSRSGSFYAAAAASQRTADVQQRSQEHITLQEVAPDISLPTEWIY